MAPHTKTLGREYANELSVPNPPERDTFFRRLEADLQQMIAVSDRLKLQKQQPAVAGNLPAVGRVRALANFHMQQQANVTGLDQTNADIIRLRQWLFRQGAKLTPKGNIIWERSHARVVYDTELAQQNFTKVTVKGGVFTQADGKVLDTKNMVTATMGPGWAIYVMSAEGNMHISSHSVGHRHHSSLLGGGPVAGAGELRVVQGRLVIISNKSGHYKPEPFFLLQVMDRLLADGVSVHTQLMAFVPNQPPKFYRDYVAFRSLVAFPVVERPAADDGPALVWIPDEPEPDQPKFVSVPGYPKY